ncbi:MAG: RNA polymerase factor sigma-54 [bacterium]|nr:RNA polymerase factor sigma-54 [Candidatus Sumerlaeota bacterium]
MALSLQQVQKLKQVQRMVPTLQMQQAVKLLQMTSLELEQLALQEITENPFLEMADDTDEEQEEEAAPEAPPIPESDYEGKGFDEQSTNEADTPDDVARFDEVDMNWDEYYDDSAYARRDAQEADAERDDPIQRVETPDSLYDHLMWQLHVDSLDKTSMTIGEHIIGSLDDDGYLRIPLDEIAADLKVSADDVERVLKIIQTFDPTGVAARNLAECLNIQLRANGVSDPVVYEILEHHLLQLQKKQIAEIAARMNIDTAKVIHVFDMLAHLEPRPGRSHTGERARYITPDVVVKKVDNDYMVYLNEGNTGGLRINNYYRRLFQDGRLFDGHDIEFAKEKFRSAVWLIKNIEKRKATILKVTEAIMTFQRDFLEKGPRFLHPLKLRQIAEIIGMHESTVGRVTNGKYVETPRGIYELKYFFSSTVGTYTGDDASSRAIKEMVSQIIAEENPEKPLNDEQLTRMIHHNGIAIARRTVTKYREQMRILNAKMRKRIM